MVVSETNTEKILGIKEMELAHKYSDLEKKELRNITPVKESKWLTKWVGFVIITLLVIMVALMAVSIGNQNQLYKLGNRDSYRDKYERELEINSEITKKYLELLTHKGCHLDNAVQ